MQKLIPILILLAAGAVILLIPASKEQPAPEQVSATRCYARAVEATSDAPYAVQEHIELTFSDTAVSGTKSGTQAGPDMTNGYEGSLSGTREGDTLDLLFTYVIEGSAQSEQEIYLIQGDSIVKLRYPLVEEGDVLVPDMAHVPARQAYAPAACRG